MVCITQPFALWTDILSSTSDTTIQTAFATYECLFNHLEDTKTKFQRKKKCWKVCLITAIDFSLNVLCKYYSCTEGPGGVIYNLATVLCPEYKLSLYESKTWEASYKAEYHQQFIDYFQENYMNGSSFSSDSVGPVSRCNSHQSLINKAIAGFYDTIGDSTDGNEAEKYLNDGRCIHVVLLIILPI